MPNDAGTAYVSIKPDLDGFGRDISRGIDPHVDKSARNVESKFGGAFKGAALAAGGAFAAIGAASAFKDIIGGASDLNETISKSNTIFGANAKEIEAWAGGAAKSMGQSKQGALDAAATFGNLFVQLGTGSGEAAKMSKEMVGLASDFASFHNADPTDVIESMTAAFRGEYDAVQRYVPTINAAAVEQKALAMGLAGSTKELTAQDKALATQKLLYEGAGAAIGDFAKTSDGLANRQRILSAQFQDMKDKVGTALLPVVLKLMESFMSLGKVIGPVANGLKSAFSGEGVTSDGVVGVFERIGVAARQVFDFLKSTVVPYIKTLFTGESSPDPSPLERYALFVRQVFGTVIDWLKTNWPQIQQTIGEVVEWIRADVIPKVVEVATFFIGQFQSVVAWVQANWPAISEAVSHVINVVVGIFNTLLPIIRPIWETIKGTIEGTIQTVQAVIRTVLDIINGDWGRIWNGIKDTIGTVWEGIKSIIRTGAAAIVDFFLGAVEAILGGAARMFGWVPGVGAKLKAAADDFGNFRNSVNESLSGIRDKNVNLTLKAEGGVPAGTYVGGMATGGMVPGQGNGDTVPAWLTPGEYVIRKKAVKALGVPYLEQLNAKGYASGGLVDFTWSLPGVGGIRDSAQSMFDVMAETATAKAQAKYQADAEAAAKAGGPIGGGGASTGGLTAAAQAMVDAVLSRFPDQTMTSGYRSPERNAAVGGSPTSDHMSGRAADFAPGSDAVASFLRGYEGIKQVLWQVAGHYDHVHGAVYDQGGGLPPGLTLAYNGTGKTERVSPVGGDMLSQRDIDRLVDAMSRARVQVVASDVSRGLVTAGKRNR